MAELPSQLSESETESASSEASNACVRKSSRTPVAKMVEYDLYEEFSRKWTVTDKTILLYALNEFGHTDIRNISLMLPNKHPNQIKVFINNLKSKAKIDNDRRVRRSLGEKMSCIKKFIKSIEKVQKKEPKAEIKPDWYNPSLLLALAVIKNLEEHPKPITEDGIDYKEAYGYLAHILNFRGGSSHRDLSKESKCTNTKGNEKKTTDTTKTNEPENINKGAENEVQCSPMAKNTKSPKDTETIAQVSEKTRDTGSINENTQNTAQADTYPLEKYCYKWSAVEETKISNVLKELVGTDIYNISSDTEDTDSIEVGTDIQNFLSDTEDTDSIDENSENIAQVSDKTKDSESINNDLENIAKVIETSKDTVNSITSTEITAQSGEKTKGSECINKNTENLAQVSDKTRGTKIINKNTKNTAPSCNKSKNSENTKYKEDSENKTGTKTKNQIIENKAQTSEKTKKTANKNKDAANKVQSSKIAKYTKNMKINAKIAAQSGKKKKVIENIAQISELIKNTEANISSENSAQSSKNTKDIKTVIKDIVEPNEKDFKEIITAFEKYRHFNKNLYEKYGPFGKMRLRYENTAQSSSMIKDTENNNDLENIAKVFETSKGTINSIISTEITAHSGEMTKDSECINKNTEKLAQVNDKTRGTKRINEDTKTTAPSCKKSKNYENTTYKEDSDNKIGTESENQIIENKTQTSETCENIKDILEPNEKDIENFSKIITAFGKYRRTEKYRHYNKYSLYEKHRPFGKMRLLCENAAQSSSMIKDTENINNDTENIPQLIENTTDTENFNIYSEIPAQSSKQIQDTINKVLAIVGKNNENTAQFSEKIQDTENINKNTENSAQTSEKIKDSENITSKDSENINEDTLDKNRQFSDRTKFFVLQSIYTVLKSAIINYSDLNAIINSGMNAPPEMSKEQLEFKNELESYLGNNLHNPLGFPRNTLSAPPDLL